MRRYLFLLLFTFPIACGTSQQPLLEGFNLTKSVDESELTPTPLAYQTEDKKEVKAEAKDDKKEIKAEAKETKAEDKAQKKEDKSLVILTDSLQATPTPLPTVVKVTACIDGSDLFKVVDNKLVITHRNYYPIGNHFECPIDLKGKFLINDIAYQVTDSIPVGFSSIGKVDIGIARGSITLNDGIILVNDDDIPSSARYEFTLSGLIPTPTPSPTVAIVSVSITPIPEPVRVNIKVCVDGSDYLSIQNSRLVITHRNYYEIGKHMDCPWQYKDVIYIDNKKYALTDALPVNLVYINKVVANNARGWVTLSNGVVLVDDDAISSSAVYDFDIE
jgi:hypothetical protein